MSDRSGQVRVALVNMPFGLSLNTPPLGTATLQAVLRRDGMHCDQYFAALDLLDAIGEQDFHHVCFVRSPALEWLFVPSLAPEAAGGLDGLEALAAELADDAAASRLPALRDACTAFVRDYVDAVDWSDYDVVALSSTFHQNIASLGLARQLSERWPDLPIVFGGANWASDMGRGLFRAFEFVDIACLGEADTTITDIVRAAVGQIDPAEVPGIVFRRDGDIIETERAPLIQDLDALPVPAVDQWSARVAASPAAAKWQARVPMETARGCWWGEISHCTFCAFLEDDMAFRSKSPARVLAEVEELCSALGSSSIAMADSILDVRYTRSVLPALAADHRDYDIFWHVKPSLTFGQIRTFAEAGVRRVQPGIESLSDHVLDVMGKGTTGLNNIRTLVWSREQGVRVFWHFLYGFGLEDPSVYDEMIPLVAAIRHLDAPNSFSPVRVDRFSPMHADPAAHGLVNVRPSRVYEHTHPIAADLRVDTAYYFDHDYADGRDPELYAAPLRTAVEEWMAHGDGDGLWVTRGAGDELQIHDLRGQSRGGSPLRLDGWRARAYLLAERIARVCDVVEVIERPARDIERFFDWCVRERLAVRTDDRYLSVAVHTPARKTAAHLRRVPIPVTSSVQHA